MGDVLLESRRLEVAGHPQQIKEQAHFQKETRLSAHIRTYHTQSKQYVCSGTKQPKVTCAVFDKDHFAVTIKFGDTAFVL